MKQTPLSPWLENMLRYGPAILTVVGTVTVGIWASVSELTPEQLWQAVIGLLALIATSLLTERLMDARLTRDALKRIEERIDLALTYVTEVKSAGIDELVIRRRDLAALEDRLAHAKCISISGGSLFRLANEYRSLFENLARRGCRLSFLVTDPSSAAAEMLWRTVAYEVSDADAYKGQLKSALTSLLAIQAKSPELVEVRVSTAAPPFSLVVVENEDGSAVIQVELYAFKLPARDRPTLMLDKQRDPRLYSVFFDQFTSAWQSDLARRPT